MQKPDSITHSFLILLAGHLILDFMVGIWPVFKILAELDLAMAGMIAGIGMFVGESSQLIFGYLSDRGHHHRLLVLGLILTGATACLAYTQSFAGLMLTMLAVYVGSAAFHPAAAGMVGSWSKKKKGFYLTIFYCGGMIGAALSQILFTHTFHLMNGHTAVYFVPSIVLVICFYFHRFPKQTPKFRLDFKKTLDQLKPQQKELTLLYLSQVCLQIISLSFVFFLPDILSLKKYPEWFYMGGAYACFVLGSIAMSLPGGYLIDRYPARYIITLMLIGNVLAYYTFLHFNLSLLAVSVLLFILGAFMGVIYPMIIAVGNQIVASEAGGMTSALLMGGANSISALGLIGAGFVYNCFTYDAPVKTLQILGMLYLIIFSLIAFLTPVAKKDSPILIEANPLA